MKTQSMTVRFWNYSTDGQPRDNANIGDTEMLPMSESEAVASCKEFCAAEGIEFEPGMVAEVTDFVNPQI